MALIATVLAWGVPHGRFVLDEVRAWVWQRELMDGLERGRILAQVHGVPVILCGGTPEQGCQADAWTHGWLLLRGEAGTSGVEQPLAERLLAVGRGAGAGHVVRASSALRRGIRFEPGQWHTTFGSLRLCRDGRVAAHVKVAMTGRPRLAGDRGEPCD